ncbi:hypothetical protein VCHA53O466_140132 [Vibrio chagasii]|nr:hypothetical protein VCHA53O466_140132 [Vibrio chagasii]
MQEQIIENLQLAVRSFFTDKAMRENLVSYAMDCNNCDFDEYFDLNAVTSIVAATLKNQMPEINFKESFLGCIASNAFTAVSYHNIRNIYSNADSILADAKAIDVNAISESELIQSVVSEIVQHQAK